MAINSNKKLINLFIFIIKSCGNSIKPNRLLLLLYNADKYHLKEYGRSITNDTYIATQQHTVGINALYLMLSILGTIEVSIHKDVLKMIHVLSNGAAITSSSDYDVSYISKHEAGTIFHVIRELRDISTQTLLEESQDYAWENASCLSDVFNVDIAISAGASDSMIGYTFEAMNNFIYCNEDH